jgi:signal transduction histidine kinase
MERTNKKRAEIAFRTLLNYQQHRGEEALLYERAENITNLITDLLHLAKEETGEDPETLIEIAKTHFYAEIGDKS